MTHKILNGKRLKADKKERQTTDNSSVRHFIWLTRLMPPATLEQQTTTHLSRTFPTKTLDTKCKRTAIKDGDPNGAQLICFSFGAAKLWFGAGKRWFGTSKRWFGAGKR